jgi:hypothetical protein
VTTTAQATTTQVTAVNSDVYTTTSSMCIDTITYHSGLHWCICGCVSEHYFAFDCPYCSLVKQLLIVQNSDIDFIETNCLSEMFNDHALLQDYGYRVRAFSSQLRCFSKQANCSVTRCKWPSRRLFVKLDTDESSCSVEDTDICLLCGLIFPATQFWTNCQFHVCCINCGGPAPKLTFRCQINCKWCYAGRPAFSSCSLLHSSKVFNECHCSSCRPTSKMHKRYAKMLRTQTMRT